MGGGDQRPPSAAHSFATAGGPSSGLPPLVLQGSVQSAQQPSAFAAPEQQAAALQQQGSLTSSLQGAGSMSQSSAAPPSGRHASIQVLSTCRRSRNGGPDKGPQSSVLC